MKKKKIILLVAVLSGIALLQPLSVLASSKMIVKSSSTPVYSSAVFASSTGSGGSYEFKPDTNKTLTGSIKEYTPKSLEGFAVPSEKHSSVKTGTFRQTGNNSYKVHLTGGYGYGIVTVK